MACSASAWRSRRPSTRPRTCSTRACSSGSTAGVFLSEASAASRAQRRLRIVDVVVDLGDRQPGDRLRLRVLAAVGLQLVDRIAQQARDRDRPAAHRLRTRRRQHRDQEIARRLCAGGLACGIGGFALGGLLGVERTLTLGVQTPHERARRRDERRARRYRDPVPRHDAAPDVSARGTSERTRGSASQDDSLEDRTHRLIRRRRPRTRAAVGNSEKVQDGLFQTFPGDRAGRGRRGLPSTILRTLPTWKASLRAAPSTATVTGPRRTRASSRPSDRRRHDGPRRPGW